MTTAWIGTTSFSSVNERLAELTELVVEHNAFFVRKLLLDRPFRAQLEEDAVDLLLKCSDAELVRLRFHDDLLMDDILIAEMMHVYASRVKANLKDVRIVKTVGELMREVLKKMDFENRCLPVCQLEIAMHKKGLELRAIAKFKSKRKVGDEPSFTVATYNVNFALGRKKCAATMDVLDFVKRGMDAGVDVFVFQEVHESWIKLLDELLGSSFPFCCASPQDDAGGCAIYSRFVTEYVKCVHPTVEDSVFPAHVYRVQIGGEQIFLVNVHLRPPIEKGSGATLFSMLATSSIRFGEIKKILELPELKDQHLIIAGDWNENDGMSALAHCVLNLNMSDALSLTDKDTHYWPLAKVQLKDGERSFIVKKRLDHIVVSPSFLIESADVFDDRLCGSDHLLVLAKLRLNKK